MLEISQQSLKLKHVFSFRVCIFLSLNMVFLCSNEFWSSGVWNAHRSPPPSAAFTLKRAAGPIYSWVQLSHPGNQQPVSYSDSSNSTCDYFKPHVEGHDQSKFSLFYFFLLLLYETSLGCFSAAFSDFCLFLPKCYRRQNLTTTYWWKLSVLASNSNYKNYQKKCHVFCQIIMLWEITYLVRQRGEGRIRFLKTAALERQSCFFCMESNLDMILLCGVWLPPRWASGGSLHP